MAFWNKKKKKDDQEEFDESEAILREFDDDDDQGEIDDDGIAPSEGRSQAIDFGKLGWLTTGGPQHMTPEQLQTMFRGIGGPSDRPGWLENIRSSRLSCVAVVQANRSLFDPDGATWAPAVLLAYDAPESADTNWMRDQLARLQQALSSGQLPEIKRLLGDSQSEIDITLPQEFTGGPRAKIFVATLNPELLPGGYIPQNRILPFLQHGEHWSQIPTSWYQ